ncbi:MAG: endonuclease domain-containing protein, partial [Acidimicrobiia bacterium]
LAPVLGPRHLRSLVQHCLIQRLCKWTELEETLTKLARRGRPGSKPFRDVLTEIGPGVALSESVLELLAYELLICHGLPEPVRQHPLPWRDTRDGRVDLVYPHARLIIELDGRRWHTQAEAFEMDRRRDNLAQLAGWRVLRFTWQQLKNHPEEFIAVVAQALAQQSPVAGS